MACTEPRFSVIPGDGRELVGIPALLRTKNKSFARSLHRLLELARHDELTILIEGETGTGKTHLARLLHRHSPRAHSELIEVDVSSMDDGFAASDLFGHVAGAYTGARDRRQGLIASASGGTLFLDEIGKASSAVQRRLLTVIETGQLRPLGADRTVRCDVRVLSASNVKLEDLATRGEFLPDLFARIGMFRIVVPPLRDRSEDIPSVVQHFVEQQAARFGYSTPPDVDCELMAALQRAPWPFNLREVEAAVRWLMIEAACARVLQPAHCPPELPALRAALDAVREVLTCELAMDAVRATKNNVSAAAKKLGVDRTTLYRYLPPDFRSGAHDGRACRLGLSA